MREVWVWVRMLLLWPLLFCVLFGLILLTALFRRS